MLKIFMMILWLPLVVIGIVLGIMMSPLYIGHRMARYAANMFQLSLLDKLKK